MDGAAGGSRRLSPLPRPGARRATGVLVLSSRGGGSRSGRTVACSRRRAGGDVPTRRRRAPGAAAVQGLALGDGAPALRRVPGPHPRPVPPEHGRCMRRAAGSSGRPSATVPSVRGRGARGPDRRAGFRVPHPFDAVVDATRAFVAVPRLHLLAGTAPVGHLRPAPGAYEVAGHPAGRRVLVLDDTWTTGAHARSAAAALIRAGAEVAGILVVGRVVDPAAAAGVERWWGRVTAADADRARKEGAAGRSPGRAVLSRPLPRRSVAWGARRTARLAVASPACSTASPSGPCTPACSWKPPKQPTSSASSRCGCPSTWCCRWTCRARRSPVPSTPRAPVDAGVRRLRVPLVPGRSHRPGAPRHPRLQPGVASTVRRRPFGPDPRCGVGRAGRARCRRRVAAW